MAAASLGGADVDPAGGRVGNAGEAWGFDKGLDEHGRGAVHPMNVSRGATFHAAALKRNYQFMPELKW